MGEDVRLRGLGIEAEGGRPDEQDGACGLAFHADDFRDEIAGVNRSTILRAKQLPGGSISKKVPSGG
jgi:hypothetical protein